MQIKMATFIKSAAEPKQFLQFDKPVICCTGRSNVGKSSFINMLANQKKLAKTSNTPGRTRLVNYFDFGEFILADLPGYGYASVSKQEKVKWGKTLERFFELTEISHVFALVDVRHKPTQDDKDMIKYLYANIIPFTVTTTKADKLSRAQLNKQLKEISQELSLGVGDIISTSYKGYGKDKVLEKIEKVIENFYNSQADSDLDDDVGEGEE
ncbi:MAG: YihA family ribosome biogenesis GTP-binding protein [Clostridia bacterium]|nr:YihA family ribosome biogenesis GTP-binding protein [Clostridia bacterium]